MFIVSSCLSKRRCFLAGLKCEGLSSCSVAMKALKVVGRLADVSTLFSLLLFEGLDTAALGNRAIEHYLNSISIREPQLEQNMAVTLWPAVEWRQARQAHETYFTARNLRRLRSVSVCRSFDIYFGVSTFISVFRHLFQCFDIYFGVLISTSVFFKLKNICVFGNIFVCLEIYLCVLKYICVFWNLFVCFEIYLCILKYICVLWNIFVYFEIYLCVVKYICVFWNIFVYFEIYLCVALVGHRKMTIIEAPKIQIQSITLLLKGVDQC